MQHPEPVARRLFDLTEPISLVNFFSPEPNEAMAALGFRNYWDGYFAGRSAPLGRVPAEVVHAAFYSFADGEVARHIPKVWDTTTPEAAQPRVSRAALRRCGGSSATSSRVPGSRAPPSSSPRPRPAPRPRAGSCTPGSARSRCPRSPWPGCGTRPTCSASTAGTATSLPWSPSGSAGPRPTCSAPLTWASTRRSRSAGSTTSPRPAWPRSWTACASAASSMPPAGFTDAGRAVKARIESLTDALAEAPYDGLEPHELDQLIGLLEPISSRLQATGSNSEAAG